MNTPHSIHRSYPRLYTLCRLRLTLKYNKRRHQMTKILRIPIRVTTWMMEAFSASTFHRFSSESTFMTLSVGLTITLVPCWKQKFLSHQQLSHCGVRCLIVHVGIGWVFLDGIFRFKMYTLNMSMLTENLADIRFRFIRRNSVQKHSAPQIPIRFQFWQSKIRSTHLFIVR